MLTFFNNQFFVLVLKSENLTKYLLMRKTDLQFLGYF
jgi:hypothetical protein